MESVLAKAGPVPAETTVELNQECSAIESVLAKPGSVFAGTTVELNREFSVMESLLAKPWPAVLRDRRLHRRAIRVQCDLLTSVFGYMQSQGSRASTRSTAQSPELGDGVEDFENRYDKLRLQIGLVLPEEVEKSVVAARQRFELRCLDECWDDSMRELILPDIKALLGQVEPHMLNYDEHCDLFIECYDAVNRVRIAEAASAPPQPAACVYVQTEVAGATQCALLAMKTKVAPADEALAANLVQAVKRACPYKASRLPHFADCSATTGRSRRAGVEAAEVCTGNASPSKSVVCYRPQKGGVFPTTLSFGHSSMVPGGYSWIFDERENWPTLNRFAEAPAWKFARACLATVNAVENILKFSKNGRSKCGGHEAVGGWSAQNSPSGIQPRGCKSGCVGIG